MTRKRKEALRWFAVQLVPVGLFGEGTPSRQMVKVLTAEGLLEEVRPAAFGLIRYRISDAGRAALEAKP